MRKTCFAQALQKNPTLHREIITSSRSNEGLNQSNKRYLRRNLGHVASLGGDVTQSCSWKDEPASAWRKGEGQREGTLCRVCVTDAASKHRDRARTSQRFPEPLCFLFSHQYVHFLFLICSHPLHSIQILMLIFVLRHFVFACSFTLYFSHFSSFTCSSHRIMITCFDVYHMEIS